MYTRLKKARKELGLSQAEVAKELDVSQAGYSKIEKGINPLQDKYLRLFCLAYGVNENWLKTGEGEMKIEDREIKEFENLLKDLNPANKQSVLNIIKEVIKIQNTPSTSLFDVEG